MEVVEAAGDERLLLSTENRGNLLPRDAQVLCKRDDLLKRSIVQVEAEPNEPALRPGNELRLARRSTLEEGVALEYRRKHSSCLTQPDAQPSRLNRVPACDERAEPAVPPLDADAVELRRGCRLAG